MGIWFLIALIILGIIFAINIYIYENSEFNKITNYSLLNIWNNGKVKKLYKVAQSLKRLQGEKKVLFNVILPNKEKIDAIVISESGVHVIDIIDMNGWIYGREQDPEWAQALFQSKNLNTFNNPIIDSKKRILVLREILKIENKELFHSIILFSNGCTIKKVDIQSENVAVMNVKNLKQYWSNKHGEQLKTDEINKIYSSLEPFMEIKKESKSSSMNQTATN
ncbi:MAG: NERD domain-containing protein [Lysinibacillus sp.]|nr:NERD domain-containing protein [Lysinibacillus sp.]